VKALAILTCVLAAGPAFAQAPPPLSPVEQQQLIDRRNQIKVMEGVLAGAAQNGVAQFGRKYQALGPNFLIGTARAHGFILPDHGLFFDVEIPGLKPSVSWIVQTMAPDPAVLSALAALRQFVSSIPDQAVRANAQTALARVERQVGPVSPGAAGQMARRSDTVQAMTVETDALATASPVSPNDDYTTAVRDALIDAMIEYGRPMGIGPDEWLTVGARDAVGPLTPGELYDATVMVLRIRGADLAAYRENRITKEEARKRVDVREF
jgi:hypothetical protein